MLSSFTRALPRFLLVVSALVAAGAPARGQSTDVGLPTPVYTSQLAGRIAPRDVGDARLTRHFYAFNTTEGDLHVTVESSDLNGDVDVFTASTLRPLLKITLYAIGSASSRVTKSVYLRRGEPLILRVEGRTVIDGDATYRIELHGSFRPAEGTPPQLADAAPTPESASAEAPRGRRTSSTGARLPETPAEREAREAAAAAEAAAAEEARRLAEEARREEAARAEAARNEEAAEPAPRRATGRRSTRPSSRTGSRRTRPAETETPAERTGEERASDTTSGRTEENTEPAAAEPSAPRPTRRGATRRGARGARRTEPPAEDAAATRAAEDAAAAEAEAEPSPRLIIVTRDGELIARDMKTVRRVTVERGQIVVTGTDGRVERHPMTNVVRMAIEP